ncbi:MAG: hypothetical protein IJV34_03655, partial [Prevotella sp.]|nr:hypothetical protein [Prevotella sp.]
TKTKAWNWCSTRNRFSPMPHRELNNANAVKRMTDFLGHSSTSEATSSITNNFATLSLSLSQVLTYNKLSTVSPLAGALIYGFSCNGAREAALFLYPDRETDKYSNNKKYSLLKKLL